MKFTSPVYSAASGSIAGVTYSRNRGGMYTRARAVPINPNSSAQQDARARLGNNVANWAALTEAQRQGWNSYAVANPIIDALGEPRNIGGLGWFIRCNSARLQGGLSQVSAAPVENGPAILTPPVVTVVDASDTDADFTFDNTDPWAGEVGGALIVYASRPQPVTINSFGGPFQYAGKILGAVSPPTSPGTVDLPFPVATGQRVFFRFLSVMADGRISADRITFLAATA